MNTCLIAHGCRHTDKDETWLRFPSSQNGPYLAAVIHQQETSRVNDREICQEAKPVHFPSSLCFFLGVILSGIQLLTFRSTAPHQSARQAHYQLQAGRSRLHLPASMPKTGTGLDATNLPPTSHSPYWTSLLEHTL